jgi:hypothetical protein
MWRYMMNTKNANKIEERFIIKEGSEVKGGLNAGPTTPRPSQPPKGQRPPSQETKSKQNT